jgi:tetratricopeptide (TPR) repeat protein
MNRIALLLVLAAWLGGCTSAAEKAEREASAGLALARAGSLDEARERFELALELDERNPKARYNLALTYLVDRRGAPAADHLRQYFATRPDDASARFELGRALALVGEREAAIAELQRAAALGFADFRSFEGGGLESLQDDVRFVQVRMLVAQRAGVDAFPEETRPANGTGYGGVRVNAPLPGLQPTSACGAGTPPAGAGRSESPAAAGAN